MTKWMAALVCALWIAAGAAADNNPPLTPQPKSLGGVWSGTLGKMAVTACFNGSSSANYYYQKHLIPIRMYADKVADVDGAAKRWSEDNGNWTIAELTENEMHGSWSSKDQSRSLPISLKRITPKAIEQGYDPINQACGTDEFNLPLEYPRKPTFGPLQEVNQVRYRLVTLSLDKTDPLSEQDYYVTGIEVLGDDPVAKAFSVALRYLAYDDASASMMFGIRRETLASGIEGGYRRSAAVSIAGHLLLLYVSEVANGSYRPVEMSEHEYIFDTRTGQRVSLLAWFKEGEDMEIKSPAHLPPSLAEFVYSKIVTGDPRFHLGVEDIASCYGYNTPEDAEYDLGLRDGKMRFSIPVTSNGSCGEAIEFTFDELKPYLNKKGRAALAEIADSSKKNK